MTPAPQVETTSDERVIAIIAHMFGFFGALIVWALQKDKSRFVRFQAIQSLAFNALNSLVLMLLMVGVFAVSFGFAAVDLLGSGSSGDVPTGLLIAVAAPLIWTACLLPYSLVPFALQLVAAFSVGSGRDFRYPWLGKRVERFLESPPGS